MASCQMPKSRSDAKTSALSEAILNPEVWLVDEMIPAQQHQSRGEDEKDVEVSGTRQSSSGLAGEVWPILANSRTQVKGLF